MDIVFLRELRVKTIIGVFEWERHTEQLVSIDLEMKTDVRKAAASDSIEDALDYKAVAKRVINYVGESKFRLVETLAEKVAEMVLKEFPTSGVRVTLSKPGAVTGSKDVGVIIERGTSL